MNILFLHTDFRVYWLPRLVRLYDFLRERGHYLIVVEVAGEGTPYSFSPARGGLSDWQILFPGREMKDVSSGAARKAILAKLDELKPDIVFAGSIAFASGMAAVKWCRDRRVPLVIFDSARGVDVPRSRLTNFIKRQIYGNVDAVLIPAPSHAPFYESLGVRGDRIYYGIDVVDNAFWRELSLAPGKCEEVKRRYSLPERFMLGVGRQVAKKNWLAFLQAYAGSSCRTPLVLVGNGPEHEKIERFIAENHLREFVTLVDFQPPETLSAFYRMAEVTVLPSSYGETWGLTVNEAMACGSPVLVSRRCGCCETLCHDGVTGFSFAPEIAAMTAVLDKWRALPEEDQRSMGENAERLVGEWDVAKFEQSVLEAAHTLERDAAGGYRSRLSRLLIFFWKGRYRPV